MHTPSMPPANGERGIVKAAAHRPSVPALLLLLLATSQCISTATSSAAKANVAPSKAQQQGKASKKKGGTTVGKNWDMNSHMSDSNKQQTPAPSSAPMRCYDGSRSWWPSYPIYDDYTFEGMGSEPTPKNWTFYDDSGDAVSLRASPPLATPASHKACVRVRTTWVYEEEPGIEATFVSDELFGISDSCSNFTRMGQANLKAALAEARKDDEGWQSIVMAGFPLTFCCDRTMGALSGCNSGAGVKGVETIPGYPLLEPSGKDNAASSSSQPVAALRLALLAAVAVLLVGSQHALKSASRHLCSWNQVIGIVLLAAHVLQALHS